MSTMDFRNSITALVSITFLGSILGKGLRYGLNIVISRGFGAEALGLFAFGMVIMKSGALLSRLGLDNAVVKFVPQLSDNHEERTGTIAICLAIPFVLGVGTAGAIIIVFDMFPTIASPSKRGIVPLFAMGIPLYAVTTVGISTTQAFKKTKYGVYIRDIAQSGLALIVTAVAVVLATQFKIVVLGYVLSFAVAVVLSTMYIRDLGGFNRLTEAKAPVSEVLSFSLPLMIVAVTQYVIAWTDTLMLGFLAPARDLGEYFAAFQTAALLLILLQAVNSIFPALVSELHDRDEWTTLGQVYSTLTKWIFALSLLGTIYLFLFAPALLFVFDISSRAAEISLVLLAVGQLVAISVGPAGFLLSMTGYENLETINTALVALVNVGLNYILILSYGVVGAAIATSISLSLLNILRVVEIWRFYGLIPVSQSHLRPLVGVSIATVVMAGGQQLTPPTYLSAILVGIVGLATFIIVVGLIGPDSEDWVLIKSLQEL